MPLSNAITDLYRGRLSIGSAQLLARIRALWLARFDPLDPAGSLPAIGTVAGAWVTAAQAGAAAEATRYLSALYANASGIPLYAVQPFAVPVGLVGSTASGSTVMSYLRQAPAVYFNRKGQGYSDGLAANSTLSWLNRTASSEPYRVANQTTTDNATKDDRYSGRVRRITRSGCCDFCQLIADRGYIPSHAGFAAHAHCRCTPEPEISSHVYSKSAINRARAAELEAMRRQSRLWNQGAGQQPQTIGGIDAVRLNGFGGPVDDALHMTEQARNAIRFNLENIDPSIVDRLGYINAGPDDYFTRRTALAYYQDLDRHISIRPSEFRPKATTEMAAAIEKGWWTPDGKYTAAEHTLSHELGHFLDFQLPANARYELTSHLDIDYGIRTLSDAKAIVSEYGGKTDREMMAELWAEYKTSPKPRPPALYAGRYIEDKLGPNPSPTPSVEDTRAWKLKEQGFTTVR